MRDKVSVKQALLLYLAVVLGGATLVLIGQHNWFENAAPMPSQITVIQAPPVQPKPFVIDPNGRSPGAIEPNGNGNPIEPNGRP